MCRKAEDESKIESLEVARSSLEEKLHLAEARKMKLEQRVSALTKQNAALARAGTQVRPCNLQGHVILSCPCQAECSMADL